MEESDTSTHLTREGCLSLRVCGIRTAVILGAIWIIGVGTELGRSDEPFDNLVQEIDELSEENPVTALELAEAGLEYPGGLGPVAEAALRIRIAGLVQEMGDLSRASREANRARELVEGLDQPQLLASALNELVGVALAEGRIDEALELADTSLRLRREAGDPGEIAKTLNNIGLIHAKTGRYTEATSYYLESLKTKERIGDEHSVAGTLNNLAIVSFETGDIDQSQAYLERARSIFETLGDRRGLADVLDNLGRAARKQGRLEDSLKLHLRSMELEEQLANPEGVAISLNHAGLVYNELGNHEEALRSSEAALEINRALGTPEGLGFSLLHVGIASRHLGRLNAALEAFEEGIGFARKAEDRSTLRDLVANLAEVQAEKGWYAEAYASLSEAERIDEQIINRDGARQMAELQARYATEQKDREIELLNLERAVHQLTIESNEKEIALLAEQNQTGNLMRNSLIGAFAGALICLVVLHSRYRLKRRAEITLQEKNREIVRQKETLEAQGRKISDANRELHLINLKLRELSRAVEQSPTGVMITDRTGSITYVNPRFTEFTGYQLEEVKGANPRLFKSGLHGPEFYRQLWSTIMTGQVWRGRIVNRRKDGSLYQEDTTISPIINDVGEIYNFVTILEFLPEPSEDDIGTSDQTFGNTHRQRIDFVGRELRRTVGRLLKQGRALISSAKSGDERGLAAEIESEAQNLKERVDRLVESLGSGDHRSAENGNEPSEPEALPAVRVLAVVPHRINRKVLTLLMDRLGSRVDFARDSAEARQKLESGSYDIVAVELGDAGEAAMDFARGIRADQHLLKGRRVRVVGLLTAADKRNRADYLESGFDVLLDTPVTLAGLRDCL
jgi:PAS domain S-box-containing protein